MTAHHVFHYVMGSTFKYARTMRIELQGRTAAGAHRDGKSRRRNPPPAIDVYDAVLACDGARTISWRDGEAFI